jgi:hypothetical protein
MGHRGLPHDHQKCCGIEKAQVTTEGSQTAHILLLLRAFLRLETNRVVRAVSWCEAKLSIVRAAITVLLGHPTIGLEPTA